MHFRRIFFVQGQCQDHSSQPKVPYKGARTKSEILQKSLHQSDIPNHFKKLFKSVL